MNTKKLNAIVDQYPHIKAIITAITNKIHSDRAETPEAAFFYQLRAAHKVNIFEPYTPDQKLLNDLLGEMQAGKNACEYAWELYAKKSGL